MYLNVVSSGAMMPTRPPPSTDMLETVIRPSIERPRIADPVYSMAWPVAPPIPIRPMIPRMMSFAVTPGDRSPSTRISISLGRAWISVWVARTCSTSEVPMPKAMAPNAPCVAVWLSPQTTVMPGRVSPSSGPITWTMPISGLSAPSSRSPNSAQLRSSASSCCAEIGSSTGSERSVVATLWSAVAIVRSVRRTGRPFRRRLSNGCGDVTSWTRCRSM